MSFIRKIKKGGKVYLAEVENRRVGCKVVQHFIRYVGKEADGRTVLSASMSDVQVEEVKLYPAYFMIRTKCRQSGAPTCSRLCGRHDAESRLKIGAPNPKV
jgi:ArsR family metal-binding transcriptional regulator